MKHAILTVLLLLTCGLLTNCSQPATKTKSETPALKPPEPAPEEVGDETKKPGESPVINVQELKAPPPLMKFQGTPYMTIKVKDFGTIRIKLDPSAAPENVSNVYQLAKGGFYDGLTFHRVIPGFVIQGGDPAGTGTGGLPYTVKAEIKRKHLRGAVGMARTGDQVNPERRSSSCQFYIALADLPNLDAGGYTVIGEVVSGMDVVDKIANVERRANDRPITPVVMEKVTVEEK